MGIQGPPTPTSPLLPKETLKLQLYGEETIKIYIKQSQIKEVSKCLTNINISPQLNLCVVS